MPYRVALLVLIATTALPAQNVSSAISGIVQDSQGASIPGAAVSAVEESTGFTRTTSSNRSGFFSFPDLKAGTFRITVTYQGFRKYEQRGIEIGSAEQRTLGVITLTVGELADSVTVTADATSVQLASSEKAGVLTGQEINSMALRGRDFFDVVGTLPGVVDTSDSRESPTPNSISGIYILGGRNSSKNFTVDGVTNLDTGANQSIHYTPSMDSIGEVKVLMSNYAAEHGRNSGGTISVITKGGSKNFHGTAGWYYRHESFSANNYFNNRNGLQRPLYRYNIGSYTVSGPVLIPGTSFNRERNKLFFFWSQEFQRQTVNYGIRQVRVPTELERAGDYSQSFDTNGRLIPIYDATAGRTNRTQPYPGNRIPTSQQTELGRSILKLFPLPNFVDPSPARVYQWNYISQHSGPYPRRIETLRMDYSPRQNLLTYVRLSNNADERRLFYGQPSAGSMNVPLGRIVDQRPGRGGVVNVTATISPTLFNEFVFGASQNQLMYDPEDRSIFTKAATGINLGQWYPANNPYGLIPDMTFGGVTNYANASMSNVLPYYNANAIFSFVDNVSKIAGTHSLKAGVYIERTRKVQRGSSALTATRGSLVFDRNITNPLDTNHPWANALTGAFYSYAEPTSVPEGQFRMTNFEFYVQDAWRVKPRLLVDYGFRFYHMGPDYDVRRLTSAFDPARYDPSKAPVLLRPAFDANRQRVAQDPTTGATYSAALIGSFAPGIGDPSIGMRVAGENGNDALYRLPYLKVAPRLGFAWDPRGGGRTAIRGGGGVFFDRISSGNTIRALPNPPQVYSPTVFFGRLSDLQGSRQSTVLAPGGTMTSLFGEGRVPVTYNYSFGVQQQFGRFTLVDVSYAGAITRNQTWVRNINAVPPGARFRDVNPQNADPTTGTALPPNFLRPYQGYADINMVEFGATANYNALLVSVTRRMSNGLMGGFSYTWGKTLSSAVLDSSAVSPFFAPRHRNYGPVAFDLRHVALVRFSYRIPGIAKRLKIRYLGAVTDGWETAGIARFSTGQPVTGGMTLIDGGDITGTPSESARMDVVDPNAALKRRFGRPPRGTFGNLGVNMIRQPGVNNWDLSLYKQIRLRERTSLQLRFESYNTFNHTQFQTLVTTARFDSAGAQVDPLFLEPQSARAPRRVQLALRLQW